MAAASEGDAPSAAPRADSTDTERALAAAGERAVLLLRFAESLAAVGGVDEVCATIVDQCRTSLGATGAGVALYDPAERVLRTVNLQGYPPEATSIWQTVPIDAITPITLAVRERRPAFFADREAWLAEFPEVPLVHEQFRARCALPMVDPAEPDPLGAVVLSWEEPRQFDEAERTLLRTVVALCTQSLARALAREAQERALFASAVDAMLDPVGVYSSVRSATGEIVDFRIEYVNAATVQEREGAFAAEMVGHTLRELFPYLERTARISEYAAVVETRHPLFLENVRVGTPNVDERVFDIQVAPFQDGIIIATRDVTDRHQAAAELALSEARLNAAQQVGRIGSWETTEDGTTVWSEELYRMFGVPEGSHPPPDEVLKRSIALDERMRLRALIASMWSTRSPMATEYPVLTQTGERRWFSARAEIQDGPHGAIVRGVVQDITENRELQRALSALTADLRDERAAAEVLQRALLPQNLPAHPSARVHAVYEPAGQGVHAGGDWYDAFTLPDGRLAFTVGDVAGHGLAAAATMSELRHALRAFASLTSSPGEIVTRLGRMFAAWSTEPYATCLYAVYDPEHSVVQFANAGHLPMLARVGRGDDAVTTSFVETQPGPPLGAAPYDYATETVPIGDGELFLLYTDGLVERRDEGIDAGLRRLEAALRGLAGLPARDVCERLVADVRGGARPDDDVCVLAIEVGLPGTPGDLG